MIKACAIVLAGVAFAAAAISGSEAQTVPAPAPQIVLTPPPPYTAPSPLATPTTEGQPPMPPGPAPSPIPSPTPGASSTPAPYRFVYTPAPAPGASDPPADAPTILEIDLTDQTLLTPGPLNIRVLTNPPVTTVTLHALGRDIALPKTGAGQFSVDSELPSLPFWLKGKTYAVDFVAGVPDGRSAKVTIPVTLR